MPPPDPKKALVILAHTPPPHHGQSLMVALLLEALKEPSTGALAPGVFHVDCRYSDDLKSMGRPGLHKLFLALRYALQTLAIRFRHGTATLYYVPAPGKHAAFLRDCVVLSLLRPFFRRIVFQWHAAGLSEWLENRAWKVERWIGRALFADNALSIVQLDEKVADASYFHPREIRVIPYGIPDPCPDFALPAERSPGAPIRLLFLSMATRKKGVFAAVSAWQRLNERASENKDPLYHLSIAGEFPDAAEEREFHEFLRKARADVSRKNPAAAEHGCDVEILGSVRGERKTASYAEADIFLFPSTYPWESFGVVLAEAAHFGLPCVTYQPLVGPNGLSPEYHRRVASGDLEAFVAAIKSVMPGRSAKIRADALAKFSVKLFNERMRAALSEAAA